MKTIELTGLGHTSHFKRPKCRNPREISQISNHISKVDIKGSKLIKSGRSAPSELGERAI